MKNIKSVLVLIMCMIGLNLYAQEPKTDLAPTQEKISEAERIVDKYGGAAVEAFSNAVKNVTPLAEDGFDMVVKLQIAKGIGMMLPLFFIFIVVICLPFVIKRSEWKSNGDVSNGMSILQCILWVLLVLMSVLSCFTVYDGILHLIAPEWFAIKDILSLIN